MSSDEVHLPQDTFGQTVRSPRDHPYVPARFQHSCENAAANVSSRCGDQNHGFSFVVFPRGEEILMHAARLNVLRSRVPNSVASVQNDEAETMDPLSDIIALIRPHDCVAAGLDAGGNWSIRYGAHAGLKCNAVLKGSCWLSVEGHGEPVKFEQGDCAILPKGRPFVLSSNRSQLGVDAETVYGPVRHGGTAVYGGGGDFFMTGSRFLVSGSAADVLLSTLPPVVIVRSGLEQQALAWAVQRIGDELRTPRPGGALAISHLSHAVLLEVMRCHLECAPSKIAGWLSAIADPNTSRAIAAIHADPARDWTVKELASRAGLSRTAFALHFKRVSGQTPIRYLTQWRMLLAAERLREGTASVAEVADETGYASVSAFANAFKRETGLSPRRYGDKGVRAS